MRDLRTILLVEDNPMDVELTIEALSECDLAKNVISVEDGVLALQYLRCEGKYKGQATSIPVVILLDIKMPRMDGIEVLEAIRNDEALRQIPVVMLTSSKEDADVKKCYDLGANAYVVKPVDFGQFMEAIKHIGIFWAVLNEQLPKN
jgi:CheY-like chemotaxis protein